MALFYFPKKESAYYGVRQRKRKMIFKYAQDR